MLLGGSLLAGCAHHDTYPPIVALVGDSTVTVEKGWGGAFANAAGGRATVLNFAASGRSTRSYLAEGRLQAVLDSRADYALIQFGHNGQPGKGPERETDPATSYRDFLREFIHQLRAAGTEPIIVSSVTRRRFDAEGRIATTLGPWADAARSVAAAERVAFLDLHAASIALHERIGQERSMAFDMQAGDQTHFNAAGAYAIAGLVFAELRRNGHALASLAPRGAVVGSATDNAWPDDPQLPVVGSVAAALGLAPEAAHRDFSIYLRNGLYREKLYVDRPRVRLLGQSQSGTVISYDDSGDSTDRLGRPRGTYGSFTMQVSAPDFTATDLRIENSFDYAGNARLPDDHPDKVRNPQGVALMLTGGSDRAAFRNVTLDGNQDTLFVDAGRSYFHRATIIGHVDFIFGAGRAVFDQSTIAARYRANKNPMGYVTAPSTLASEPYGLLFVNSRFVRHEPAVPHGSVRLGRPWHPGADPRVNGTAVFLDCFMDDHIDADGYAQISSTNAAGERIWFDIGPESRFFESGSHGPGAHAGPRRPQLDPDARDRYTIANVLGDWTP